MLQLFLWLLWLPWLPVSPHLHLLPQLPALARSLRLREWATSFHSVDVL